MLLGFMGCKGAGKDTCGNYLVDTYDFIQKAFADPLKKACGELFLFTPEQLYGTQEQKKHLTIDGLDVLQEQHCNMLELIYCVII